MQPEELALSPLPAGSSGTRRAGAWFETLFRQHYPRMVGVLTRLTGNRGQAEEIAADSFSKLARRPLLWQRDEDVTAWVYRVATNAGLDAVRMNSRRRKREAAAGADVVAPGPPDALDELLRAERRTRVREILEELKPREAQLLLLRANGLPYRELARTLGVEAGSVGTMLARAEAEFERKFRARHGASV